MENFGFCFVLGLLELPRNFILKNGMTSEQSIGRQEPLNCQCEGLLVLRNKSDLNFLFFRFENHCAFSINNIMYSAMFTLFPFTQTYTKKKHEVLDFINQMASVNGFVCFCPRALSSIYLFIYLFIF